MAKVVLATGNQGKVNEMQQVLQNFGLQVIPQSDFNIPDATEDGLSFVENAIKKARHACKLTKLPAIADDSGLEVAALNGQPGIHSARYASGDDGTGDAANNKKLLHAMSNIAERQAQFQCVIVYMQNELDPTPIICQGTWQGIITEQEEGEYGFGYDPLFYVPELDCHSAELDPKIKKTISHRAQALIKLQEQLALRDKN